MTALDCQRWGSLPRAGGLRDQDYGQMYELTMAYNAYTIQRAYDASKDKVAWWNEHSDAAEWLDWVTELIEPIYGNH